MVTLTQKTTSEDERDEGSTEHSQQPSRLDTLVCPECGSDSIVEDPATGELVCDECGLVIEARKVDLGPEWRAYSAEEHEEKARTGAPTTRRRHDKGLTTEIDWRDRDAYGKTLSAEQQARMKRLRRWQRRLRARGQERSLRQAIGEIERMASALAVPAVTREQAAIIFRRAMEAGLLPGRSVEAVAASALYAACRRDGVPRSLDAVANVSRVERGRIARAYRTMSRELELEIAPTHPSAFVPQIVSALELSDAVERRANQIIRDTAEKDLISGKSPKGYAAAAVYLAARLGDERVPQSAVAEAADVAEVTIRNRFHEQADVLELEY